MYKRVEHCRICNSKNLHKYVDFGLMPLANSYLDPKGQNQEPTFPLSVFFCKDCYLSTLSIVVDPKVMFSQYAYKSSISKTFQEHCLAMAEQVQSLLGSKPLLVVDIASNDGCLLREFKKKGFKILGVEPAQNLAKEANAEGITTLPEFWSASTVQSIRSSHGLVDVITATNVFAHVDDVHGFVQNVKQALSDNGLLIIEVPYCLNLIRKREFDTIYHEHLSYFLVKPIITLFESEGMEVRDVQEFPIHGGTIRVFVTKKNNSVVEKNQKNIDRFLKMEKDENLYELSEYIKFANRLLDVKIDLLQLLCKLKREQKKIAAFAASAKGNTLLNYCGISSDFVEFIVDETPEKQDHLYAGNRIPIFGLPELEKQKPDYLLILAWNFVKEIMEKTKPYQEHGGRYIIPIPSVKVVSSLDDL
ncbi:class I SAM-dependent methyltransferase [Candidatus Micrarchaeota archaeon]|nr:class I SAM-dependent methyltransferase [Candidatus Micrarchaeota archaeon]MBU1930713.1 class I SAM-dependent methyltransferase [Candidatus Micrarchaeota archaeon]